LKGILIPVDFSDITHTVTHMAARLARQMQGHITLLHVKHIKSSPDVEQKLHQLAASISLDHDIDCSYTLREGSIFAEVKEEASLEKYDIVVIGSHGFKGIREVMFGSDILKMLKLIPAPTITVRNGYILPNKMFRKILFPVASHTSFHLIVKAVINFAKIFDSEVHLYSVEKPEIKWTDQLISNITLAESAFKDSNTRYVRVNEAQSSFSLGYSKQTLNYAAQINADLIAMMAVPAKEHFYFADGDKEQIITNKMLIPVMSTSDRF
jgi:nucleotide-binding universal stress UspA family protein